MLNDFTWGGRRSGIIGKQWAVSPNCKSFCLPRYFVCEIKGYSLECGDFSPLQPLKAPTGRRKSKEFFGQKDFLMKHSFSRRHYLFGLLLPMLLSLAAFPVRAQDPDDVVRTDTNLVQLNVGVVDPRGRAVTSLSQNDFKVYEDGVRQQILHFEPADAPFSLVLLLDTSGSTIHFRDQMRQAAVRFLDALAPEDRVALIQFNAKYKTLVRFYKRSSESSVCDSAAGGGCR